MYYCPNTEDILRNVFVLRDIFTKPILMIAVCKYIIFNGNPTRRCKKNPPISNLLLKYF